MDGMTENHPGPSRQTERNISGRNRCRRITRARTIDKKTRGTINVDNLSVTVTFKRYPDDRSTVRRFRFIGYYHMVLVLLTTFELFYTVSFLPISLFFSSVNHKLETGKLRE